MPKVKHKIHGYLYEPSCDGADKNGYIHFYDVVEAVTQEEAFAICYEDYGDYNTLEYGGEVRSKVDEQNWLARNPN